MHFQIMNKNNKVVSWKAVEEEEAQAVDHHHTVVVEVVVISVMVVVEFTVMEALISWLEWVGIKAIIIMLIMEIIHAKIAGLLTQNV